MNQHFLDRLKNSLPAQPGIMGREEYVHAAVLVLLTIINDVPHFILEKRSAHIPHAGEICFPGGRVDPAVDADVVATALRETWEELGITADAITVAGRLNTLIALRGMLVDVVVGYTEVLLDSLTLNADEVEKIICLPVSFFKNVQPEAYNVHVTMSPTYHDPVTRYDIQLLPSSELGLPEKYHKPWGDFRPPIYVYKTAEGTLWGMTARIIKDFIFYCS
jgi:8-oxo-dGTP pyrophosphatase MutT (NUDIX family)